MLNVFMLSAVMLIAVAPSVGPLGLFVFQTGLQQKWFVEALLFLCNWVFL
jgi:hypothetical protein